MYHILILKHNSQILDKGTGRYLLVVSFKKFRLNKGEKKCITDFGPKYDLKKNKPIFLNFEKIIIKFIEILI